MNPKPLVIQTEHLSKNAATWLASRATLIAGPFDDPATFDGHLAEAQGLVIRTYTQVDEAFLDRAPKLRVIGRAGVGIDNIDLNACQRRGIVVVHTPEANTEAVVQFVFFGILQHVRPLIPLREPLDQMAWNERRNEQAGACDLDELTLGIYGLGRIGQRVAAVGVAFGMRVLYHDLLEIPESQRAWANPMSRDELLAESDIITMHVDGRPENRHLINADALNHVQPDFLFINSARGMIVDAAALADFLKANPNAHALIDVHDPEPFSADYPLINQPNAFLTPHLAGRTETALERMSEVVQDVWAVLEGHEARWVARPQRVGN